MVSKGLGFHKLVGAFGGGSMNKTVARCGLYGASSVSDTPMYTSSAALW